MKFISLAFFFFAIALPAEAHVPVLVSQESLFDITTIEDPTLSQAFYGEMTGFPHTYEIKATEPFHFFAQVLVPNIDSSTNNISGIIIREPEAGGQVHEIAPILSQEAEWKSVYEPFGGDSYREGPVVEKELEAGTYRIEVHTPNNVEKYVLVVGKREEMTLGYFELVRRIAGVKLFFEKSQFRIIESPFIYVPLLGMGILFVIARAIRRYSAKRRKTTNE